MQKSSNNPFLFAVKVWVATWLFTPLLYLGERMVPGLEEPSVKIASTPAVPFLITIYPVSLGIGFLLFGIFSYVTDYLARTKMPAWLIKSILSVLVFALIRLGFFLIGAQMQDWLGLFRAYYLAVIFIWLTPLKTRQVKLANAESIS